MNAPVAPAAPSALRVSERLESGTRVLYFARPKRG